MATKTKAKTTTKAVVAVDESVPESKSKPKPKRRRASRRSSALTRKMAERGYLTCPAVAERIGVHRSTVYRWISDDLVESVDLNGAYYVKWDSVVDQMGRLAEILELTSEATHG